MEKPKSSAELRKFIRSHEARYFADIDDYGCICIRKAYKVKIDKATYWIRFGFGGVYPRLVPKRTKLVETFKEAREEVQRLRNIQLQEEKEYEDKVKEVANFLDNHYWRIGRRLTEDESFLNPDEQLLAREIRRLYYILPNQERDDDRTYIRLLENYIKHGIIYTQALSFRKEQVVCVKYASESKTVQVELINGTTIIPKSNSVVKLIKTIFGERLDSIYDPEVKLPTGNRDLIGSRVLK